MMSGRVYLVVRCIVLLCSTHVFGDMTSSSNPALVGQPVVFTVQINAPGGISAVPTGSVALTDAGTVIGTANLQNGVAAITVTFAVDGDHSIVANYSGDQNFQPSSTTPLLQRITASDAFTLAVAPSSVGQQAGAASEVAVTLFANGTSPETVQLSCENLPPGTSCAFRPNIIQPSTNGQMTTLTITSRASQVAMSHKRSIRTLAFALPFVLGGVLMFTPARKWNARPSLFGGIWVLSILSLAGCGSALKILQGGTPAGSYTIHVVGSNGTFAQNTNIQLNVSQ